MENKWKDAVEKAVKKDAPLRLEVGKKYRNGFGKIVTIIEEDKQAACGFRLHGDDGYWYKVCGQANSSEHEADVVALVDDEPAKPEGFKAIINQFGDDAYYHFKPVMTFKENLDPEPAKAEESKKNPPFAVGQVWRRRSGGEATIYHQDKDGDLRSFFGGGDRLGRIHKPDGTCLFGYTQYDLVEYLRETDRPRLDVGKKYRTQQGEIVRVVEYDGSPCPFGVDNKRFYSQFGFHVADDGRVQDHIVALVEDEPAKAEETPTRPLRLEVGKRYRREDGSRVTIVVDDGQSTLQFRGSDGRWYEEDGTCPGTHEPIVALAEEEPAKPEEPKKNPPLTVGQVWRRRDGKKATVLSANSHLGTFEVNGEDGMRCHVAPTLMACVLLDRYDLVEYIGEANLDPEPAKAEEPKKNPPLAVGQAWRTADGCEAHITCYKDRLFAAALDRGWALNADGTNRWDDDLNLVEYIGEANLDPKAEDVVQSKEIPLSEEATMSSKPQDRHESPQQDDRFTQYLIEECARLRDMLEQKDERIDELSRRLMETAQESIHKQKIMFESILALQMETERQRAADRESLKKDDINALRELCSSNFDAVFEELSSIKESNIETAGDVAAVGGMLAAMQERPECPAPVPATPPAPQEDALDKGLKLTNRTLTAAQIVWKIIQFAIAFSLFGGAATCAVMMLK